MTPDPENMAPVIPLARVDRPRADELRELRKARFMAACVR